jgi:hypothetical protein
MVFGLARSCMMRRVKKTSGQARGIEEVDRYVEMP